MRIVAFIDPSLYGRSVADHAAWLALAGDAEVDLVQIVSPNELLAAQITPAHPGAPVIFDSEMLLGTEVAELKRAADARLEDACRQLRAQGVTRVRPRTLEGNVQQLMAEAAADATLVVMGKRGEHADLARLPLGSNLEPFVRAARVPVLAVSRTFRPVQRLLIAVGRESAAASAVTAIASGVIPRMPVRLLHVGADDEAIPPDLQRAATLLTDAGYECAPESVPGLARQVVPEQVVRDGVDLVAIDAFGESRLQSLLFGSLTTELIRACQVPILLCQ